MHPFFGLNAFLISAINPLLRTLVRKYAERKGPVADPVCGSTTWSRGLLLPLLDSRHDREQSYIQQAPPKNFSTLNFNFEKLNSFFLLLNSHREGDACYEGSGRYNSILKSWIALLDSRHDREQSCLLWLCLNLLTSGLWISTSKSWIRFFFYFSTVIGGGCLLWRFWSWSICFGHYTLKSWISLFTSRQERERERERELFWLLGRIESGRAPGSV